MYIAGTILSKGLDNFHILTMLNCINLYKGTNQFSANISALFLKKKIKKYLLLRTLRLKHVLGLMDIGPNLDYRVNN